MSIRSWVGSQSLSAVGVADFDFLLNQLEEVEWGTGGGVMLNTWEAQELEANRGSMVQVLEGALSAAHL